MSQRTRWFQPTRFSLQKFTNLLTHLALGVELAAELVGALHEDARRGVVGGIAFEDGAPALGDA